jgi:hypothetical protein
MTEPEKKIPIGATAQDSSQPESITLAQLLQDEPLHSPRLISSLFSDPHHGQIDFPQEIHIHCAHEKCRGVRRHVRSGKSGLLVHAGDLYQFVSYECTNCTIPGKVFGVKARLSTLKKGMCVKLYEEPAFGHPIPKRLFQVIGETNREPFLQARRAIGRGLGIGAYTYYRRIVENTKFELVDSVLEVARATNASPDQIKLIEHAQSERQFSKAIETLRDASAIPAVLLIDGHNPLTLLHDLLSEGIHELTDQECLKRAQEAEVILCEIADRMQIALTERKTVKAAITSIMNRKRDLKK